MKKCRAKPAQLDLNHEYDQTILEVCPGYYRTFMKMGLKDVAAVCLQLPAVAPDMTVEQRKAVAKALDAFAEELNDKDEEYYLSRLADRVLGYTAAEED
jgi:hypothetical protein